jgi:D-proline reductase (dithiol) PrdB
VADSYRFLDGATARIVRAWAARPVPGDVPWTPLAKPLAQCTVAFVTSAGLSVRGDRPFDQEIERRDPWFSDPSWRRIPLGTASADVCVSHLHINPSFAREDLGCILPLQALAELASAREIGRAAPSHYSYMGYTLRPRRLLEDSVPEIIEGLRAEQVDAVVLVPV